MLTATLLVTAAGCALGELIAGGAGLVAIWTGLGLWVITGFALSLVGASLGHHAHLIDWGIAFIAAALAGTAVGLPLAARR